MATSAGSTPAPTAAAAMALAPTNAEICHFFFEAALEDAAVAADAPGGGRRRKRSAPSDDAAELPSPQVPAFSPNGRPNRHRCRLCWNTYTQNASTGYTNLMTHLRIKHPEWPEIFRAQRLPPPPFPVVDGSTPPVVGLPPVATTQPQRMQSGRKRGPVYSHFSDAEATDDRAGKRMICSFCGADVPQLSARLKQHLATQCGAAPASIKAEYAQQIEASEVAGAAAPRATKRAKKASVPGENGVKKEVKLAKPARDQLQVLQTFEDQITGAIVATGTDWSFLDNVQFQAALATLRPDGFAAAGSEFPLSSARATCIVAPRLGAKYDQETAAALEQVTCATLLVDHSQADMTAFVAVDEWRRSFLLHTRTTIDGTSNRTAETVSELEAVVKSQPFAEGTKLFLCSDATDGVFAQVRALLRDLQQAPAPVLDDGERAASANPFVLVGSCLAQQSLLLLKDVVMQATDDGECVADALALATALTSSPDLERAMAVAPVKIESDGGWRYDGERLSVADWSTVATAVHQLVRLEKRVRFAFTEESARAAVAESTELSRLKDVVADDSFWKSLSGVKALLEPFNVCAAASELPITTAGQYLSLWTLALSLAMESPLLSDETKKTQLADRFFSRLAVYAEDHHIASWVLDPRVQGAGLSGSGLRRARGVTVRVAQALLPDLDETSFLRAYNDYMKQQGDFGDDGVWNAANTSDPLQFWSDFESDAAHAQLALIGKAVCSFVPQASSLQSHWASHVSPPRVASPRRRGAVEPPPSETVAKIRYTLANGDAKQRTRAVLAKFSGLLASVETRGLEAVVVDNVNAEVRQVDEHESIAALLQSLDDSLEQDAAVVEANQPSNATKMDVSWLDLSSTGVARIESAVRGFLHAAAKP